MQKSTATVRSQNQLISTNNRATRQQRTATSNRTGAYSSSAHTSSNHKVVERQKPKIYDDANNDVTPKPLLDVELNSKARHGSALFHSIEGTSTPTDMLSNGSILNTNAILTTAHSFGPFPESSTHVSNDSNQAPTDSVDYNPASNNEKEQSALFFIEVEKKKKLDSKFSFIKLNETETFVLLDFPGICISKEEDNFDHLIQKNQKYLELCKSKSGNDSYAERGVNTFNDLPKLKSTQTEKLGIAEKGVNCSTWDMYDSYNGNAEEQNIQPSKNSDNFTDSQQMPDLQESATTNNNSNEANQKEIATNYLSNENLKNNLFFMERLINLNTYQPKQARFRSLKAIEISENRDKPNKIAQYDGLSLEKLWTYSSGLTKDRNVSCLVWNSKNKDILAAGYGKFEFNDDPSGLVCCWSIKNIEYPERYFKTDAGVTALAFSKKNPNLLAVGLFNGSIIVFDVRENNTIPLITTNESEHKHLSPVWNLKWTDKDRASSNSESEEMEVLMSISSDGRITQWMIRKGFESFDYLKLKRVINQAKVGKKEKDKKEGLISRHSGGLCFDILDHDKSIYLCGTEEGLIHKCSTSYNEQYLDTFYGHTGPIYKLAWSPFLKDCFLSASADWTIRLWKTSRNSSCLTMSSNSKSVFDICWSNKSATLFSCVNENSIEIWDLSKNTLEPIYTTNSIGSIKFRSITYSPNSDSLVIGTNDGSLFIYSIKNLPTETKEKDLDEIIKHSLISQLENIKPEDDEARDLIEKHQLDSFKTNENESEIAMENKTRLDAFEAKIDKIKSENEAILQGKLVHKKKGKKTEKNSNDDSSDSDD